MLNIGIIKNLAGALKYFEPEGHDYWVEDRDTQAFFGGKLAGELGLGEFDRDQFHSIMHGFDPRTARRDKHGQMQGDQLTPGKKGTKRAGWEVTLDGPKDLGVLAALGYDDRIIPDVLERAVRDVMALIEQDAQTRVRVGKQDTDRQSDGIVYAAVRHMTARPEGDKVDVQPHYHVLVANVTWNPVEGRYKALQLQPFAQNGAKEARPLYMAYFNAKLGEYMRGLGYEIEREGDSFRVVGMPPEVVKEFSQRAKRIDEEARRLERQKQSFLKDPTAKLSLAAKAKLAKTTRERKEESRSWDSLMREWEGRVTADQRHAVLDTVAGSLRREREAPAADPNAAALDWACWHAFERKSVVSQRELLTHALKHGVADGVTLDGLLEEVGKRPDLIRRDQNGRTLVTLRGILAEERGILDFAIKGRGRCRRLGRKGAQVPKTLTPGEVHPPTRSQAAAMRAVWDSVDRVLIVRGLAGVGKSKMLKATLDQVDVPHVVLAPSSDASRNVLRTEGFPEADTLARFLVDEKFQEQARGGLVVLDEASLAGSRDVARLTKLVDQLGARLLLLGDRRQHKSVSRGDVLAMLEDKGGLPVAEVSEIKRQAGDYKRAVEALARGDVGRGFDMLDGMEWVREPNEGEAIPDLVAGDYLDAMREGKSVLIIGPTHAVGDAITARLRERLKHEGKTVYVKDPGDPEGKKTAKKEVGILQGKEEEFDTLVPLHLTEAERSAGPADGTVAVFTRHGGGRKAGARVAVTAENREALGTCAASWAAYRPAKIALAKGDLVRIAGGGKSVEGNRLNTGTVYSVDGFDARGNVRLDNGWTLARDGLMLGHGYALTSHAAQGQTKDRVIVAMGAESFGAVGKDQFYVSVSRGRERATVYTDSKAELKDAVHREDSRLLASDLVREPRRKLQSRLKRMVTMLRQAVLRDRAAERQPEVQQDRGMEIDR